MSKSIYPLYVDNVDVPINRKLRATLNSCIRSSVFGHVGTETPPATELTPFKLIEAALKDTGYVPGPSNKYRLYHKFDYTYGAGSIDFHADQAYGLGALLLIAKKPLKAGEDSSCYLLTANKDAEMNLGDLVIFNGDAKHAWMANCRWVLATMRVKRCRKQEA